MPVKYSPHQAIDLIRKIHDGGGYIVPGGKHAKERMVERNVDMQDLETLLLETGHIEREPEWDEKFENYRYRVEGKDIDGDDLVAIVAIDEQNGGVVVVTVF